ncbi:MAG: AraC family transcriptional regulator [Lachnospiraceae bacterium]|nr:AraC family transcriptional regulator [Lachnospiraceae bacterium]
MKITSNIPELSKREHFLKEQYLSFPARHLNLPCEVYEVADILSQAYDNQMTPQEFEKAPENSFIEEDLDCSLVRHMRYTPATWHTHEFFELLYVIHGSCDNYFNDHSISMTEGDICISAPGSSHAVSAFSDGDILLNVLIRKTTFERYFLGLMEEDDILSTFFRRALYEKSNIPYIIFHTKKDAKLKEIIQQASFDFHGNRRFKRQYLNTCLSLFFIELLRNYEHTVETPGMRQTSENIVFILKYIQQHYNSVTLKELSAFFNYSQRQIQRLLVNATGMSFMEIVQSKRMKTAEQLLTTTTLSVEEICEKTGYQSPNNFRRIFAKYHHQTPREYRNAHTPAE